MAMISLIMAFAVGFPAAQDQTPKPADPWARLNFLIGEWQGLGSGAPGEAVGGTSFTFGLDKRVLIRKNWAKYPAKLGEKEGFSHEDLMIIYPGADGASFRAIYFDNEGHVINYSVSVPQKVNTAVFESEPAPPDSRYRLTYELDAAGDLNTVFLIARPGEAYVGYVRGVLRKK